MPDNQRSPQPAQHYEICVRGRLGDAALRAFEGLEAEAHGKDTTLRGALPDQAALHGVLGQIESLALELLEVRRVPSARARHPQESPDPRVADSP
jgi:hypothetical protein